MPLSIKRRDFFKLTGLGAAVTAAGVFAQKGSNPYFSETIRANPNPTTVVPDGIIATTCPGCELSCGLLVHLKHGSIQKIAGNPEHPVNQGLICSKAESIFQTYQASPRLPGPLAQQKRCSGNYLPISWLDAETILARAFRQTPGSEIFFLGRDYPAHLDDFLSHLNGATGSVTSYRTGQHSAANHVSDFLVTTQKIFGVSRLPIFDTESTDLIYAFGLEGSEPWLNSLTRLKMTGGTRQLSPSDRGASWVFFSSHRPDCASPSDRWTSIAPGSEGQVAAAVGRLIISMQQGCFPDVHHPDIVTIRQMASLGFSQVVNLVEDFVSAKRKIALPGLHVLQEKNSAHVAETLLRVHAMRKNQEGCSDVYFLPPVPVSPCNQPTNSTRGNLNYLIERMQLGMVKTLMVHGSPCFDDALLDDFLKALANVSLVISFSPEPDAITPHADFIFPDHHILESWGYEKPLQSSDRMAISAMQPVFAPALQTRSTIDLLTKAVKRSNQGLYLINTYQSQIDYLLQSLEKLRYLDSHQHAEPEVKYWSSFFRRGGWWPEHPAKIPAVFI